jgi:hypothetical protein
MEFGLQALPVGARTGPEKNPFLVEVLWVRSYRLSHKRARSAYPLKSNSATSDGHRTQDTGQSEDNSDFSRIENTLKIR